MNSLTIVSQAGVAHLRFLSHLINVQDLYEKQQIKTLRDLNQFYHWY